MSRHMLTTILCAPRVEALPEVITLAQSKTGLIKTLFQSHSAVDSLHPVRMIATEDTFWYAYCSSVRDWVRWRCGTMSGKSVVWIDVRRFDDVPEFVDCEKMFTRGSFSDVVKGEERFSCP